MIACGRRMRDEIRAIRSVSDSIVLSGGEVTVLKSIWDILTFCRKNNFRSIDLVTNCRKLNDRSFSERLVKAGVNNFAVSLYSSDERIHDRITRVKGSCRETKSGIKNLLRLSTEYAIDLRVNIVLNPWNYNDIDNTLGYLSSLGVKNFIIAEHVVIDKNKEYLTSGAVSNFLAHLRSLNLASARITLRGFAPCLCGDISSASQGVLKDRDPLIVLEAHEMDTLINTKGGKNQYLKKLRGLFTYAEKCDTCGYAGQCPGIQKIYL